MAPPIEENEYWPLSGKPYFGLVLSKSHVNYPCTLVVPIKMHSILPSRMMPVVLRYKHREWKMMYQGNNQSTKKFSFQWRDFVNDNGLKRGDGCVFELTECTDEILKFQVQILRGDPLPQVQDQTSGTEKNPITID